MVTKMKNIRYVLPIVFLLAFPSIGLAKIITGCGSSKGHTYFNNDYRLLKAKKGFNADGVDGYVFLKRLDDGKLDLVYKDSLGREKSAIEQGAVLTVIRKAKTNIAIQLLFPTTEIEIYNFFRNIDGTSEFVYLKNKAMELESVSPYATNSSSMFSGPCFIFDPD
jgi:hypothetical protein